MNALSVGSFVQNIALYLVLSILVHANYCLLVAVSDKKRGAARRTGELCKEKAPNENIAGLQDVLEGLSDAVYIVDREWNFIDCSAAIAPNF